jgi:hypothetical protein
MRTNLALEPHVEHVVQISIPEQRRQARAQRQLHLAIDDK